MKQHYSSEESEQLKKLVFISLENGITSYRQIRDRVKQAGLKLGIGRTTLWKLKKEYRDNPSEQPKTLVSQVQKEINKNYIEKLGKEVTESKQIAKQVKREKKQETHGHKDNELLYIWSTPCPDCGHRGELCLSQPNQSCYCAQCNNTYDRKNRVWHKNVGETSRYI